MRDFSCFGDSSVSVAAPAAASVFGGRALDRSLQAATTSVYNATLSSGKEFLIRVTWTRSTAGATGITIAIDEGPSASPSPASTYHFLQKKNGSHSFVTDAGTAIGIYWDTAAAQYPAHSSPEPSRDYYLAVVADAELVLLRGDNNTAHYLTSRFAAAPRRALLSRREQLRGAMAAHTTRCKFREDGQEHNVTVSCKGDGREQGEVCVCIDGKEVVEVRRVGWGFRGSRKAVLAGGAVVDVMWDVHDWWFGGHSGGGAGAQFMVKARAEREERLWMDEELARRGQPPVGFFLHVQCYKR